MLEASRKNMWKASDNQIKTLADLHTDLVEKFGAEPSGFSSENTKLQNFISKKSSPEKVKTYQNQLQKMKNGLAADKTSEKGKVLKQESISADDKKDKHRSIVYG